MYTLRIALTLVCLAGVLLGPASRPACAQPGWSTFDVRDGLLSPTVHSLAATRAGGLLVGTSGGPNQWDGARWRQYSVGNGLAAGQISAVEEAPAAIWAGSWGGGLSVLRGDTWRTYRAADSPLPSDWIADLAADGASLWIATYGGGLARLRGDEWTLYRRADESTTSAPGLPSDWLTCVLPDGAGGVWVGSDSALASGRVGLAHLTAGGRWETVALPDTADKRVTALAWRQVAERELWVGAPTGLLRLTVDDAGGWRGLPIEGALAQQAITALCGAADGRMWVGTSDGLYVWDRDQLTRYGVREGLPHNAISALALDTDGRLWAGTLTAGLAVQGDVPHPTVERLPVVLVHGWRSADSDRLEDSELWHMASWLRADGFPAYFATGISPANTLHQNAAALRATIDQALRESGAQQVYLIAFSMGGLNTRAYLESTLYRGDVARAFILGSPHQGEDLWLSFLLWEHLAWSAEPSTLELLPAHMALFNATHTQPGTVPYVLIAGDATLATDNLADARLPTLFGELPPSDGLVSTWSALGPATLTGERRLTTDLHAWATETLLLDLPSLLLPRGTYDAHIRPYLFGVGDAPGAGSPVAVDTTAYAPADAPRSALRVGMLAPGQSVTLDPIPVEAVGRTRFYLRWDGPALDMALRDPAGQLRMAERPGADAEYLELGFAAFASYVITDTLPGAWEVTLTAPQTGRTPSQYVVYAEWPATPLRLETRSTPDWVRVGESVTLTATLSGPADLAVNEVLGEVYSPSGRRTLTFQAAAPLTQGQAIYTTTYVPREGGYHSVLVTARGSQAGQAFERGAYLNVGVRGSSARLIAGVDGTQRTEGFWANTVPVDIAVAREGDYLVSARLVPQPGSGPEPLIAAHPVHLLPGKQRVSVPLTGLPLAPGVAYEVSDVLLTDISDAGVLLDRIDLIQSGQSWRVEHD